MEQYTYQNFKNSLSKKGSNLDHEASQKCLKDLLIENNVSTDAIEQAFLNQINSLLKVTDLHILIKGILDTDFLLEKIEKTFESVSVPSLTNFYNCLSPLVLRALNDSFELDQDAESSLESIKEAIRICIEEELYR